jgi:hypothetical protein
VDLIPFGLADLFLVTKNGLDAHYDDDGRFDDGILDMMIT